MIAVSASQRTICDVLPSATFRGDEVGAGFLQRRGDGDALVEMLVARLEVELPAGDFFADVLLLLFLDEPIADVGDVHLLPIELLGLGLEIGFHVGEQLGDVDFVGDELDLLGVAEAEVDARAAAGGLRHHAFELAPVADDLIELLLILFALVAGEALDRMRQYSAARSILAAIFEELCEASGRRASRLGWSLGRGCRRATCLVELDEVLVVGEFEAFDACGEPGDGFVFAERVEGPGFGLWFFCRLRRCREKSGSGSRPCVCTPNCDSRKRGAFDAFVGAREGCHSTIVSRTQRQRSPSFLAASQLAGTRRRSGCRRRRRGALRFAAVAPAFFVVGELVEIGERLESPSLGSAGVVGERSREAEGDI